MSTFSTLLNFVIDTAKVPQQWKLGQIVPVHKKECTLTKTNYRPLTILPALSKEFERLVHTKMSPHYVEICQKYVFPLGNSTDVILRSSF